MATFGKIAKGGTEDLTSAKLNYCKYTSGSAGTLASIKVYIKYYGATNMKCAIYNSDLSGPLTNGITEELAVESDQNGWMTFTFATPPSVAASTEYALAFWPESDYIYKYFDTGASDQAGYDGTPTYPTWPDPIGPDATNTNEVSIYALYVVPPLTINVHDCIDAKDKAGG